MISLATELSGEGDSPAMVLAMHQYIQVVILGNVDHSGSEPLVCNTYTIHRNIDVRHVYHMCMYIIC